MHRSIVLAGIALAVLLPSVPSFAITAKEKMATCKFGADDKHFHGKERERFLQRCMANRNDPRGSGAPTAPHN